MGAAADVLFTPFQLKTLQLANRIVMAPMTRSGSPGGVPGADVAALVDAYATGAAHARGVGFDGIEIHAAHGYLIDQSFRDVTTRRTDRYGGDLARRTRFACEIVGEMRRRVGSEFPIVLRFSQ